MNTKPTGIHFVHEAEDPPFRFGPAIREAEAYHKLIKAGRVSATRIGGSLMLESSDPTTMDFVNKAVAKGQTFPPKGKHFGIIEKGTK